MLTQHKTLSKFAVLTTTQLDEAREKMAQVYCEHELDCTHPRKTLDMRIQQVPLGDISLVYASHGADVKIATGVPETFFALQFVLSGQAEYRMGKELIECSGEIGCMISPTKDLKIRCSEDSGVLGVSVSRQALEIHLQNLVEIRLSKPLDFDGRMDFRGKWLSPLAHFIRFYVNELEKNPYVLNSPLAVRNFEQSVLTQLLLSQPHNYTNFLSRFHSAASLQQVRLIEAYLATHAGEAIKLQNLVELTGHSASSIYKAFNRHRGYTPFTFLANRRLEGLRKSLLEAGPTATVTDLAYAWGFTHLGRLSGDYKRQFRESPSDTLRKSKHN